MVLKILGQITLCFIFEGLFVTSEILKTQITLQSNSSCSIELPAPTIQLQAQSSDPAFRLPSGAFADPVIVMMIPAHGGQQIYYNMGEEEVTASCNSCKLYEDHFVIAVPGQFQLQAKAFDVESKSKCSPQVPAPVNIEIAPPKFKIRDQDTWIVMRKGKKVYVNSVHLNVTCSSTNAVLLTESGQPITSQGVTLQHSGYKGANHTVKVISRWQAGGAQDLSQLPTAVTEASTSASYFMEVGQKAPKISPPAGPFEGYTEVSLQKPRTQGISSTPNTTLLFTTDGSEPTWDYTKCALKTDAQGKPQKRKCTTQKYVEPFMLLSTTTVKAMAISSDGRMVNPNSLVTSSKFEFEEPFVFGYLDPVVKKLDPLA